MKRHNIIIPKPDGGVEVYPMKQWLRDNPEHLPQGVETTSTSHQIRSILRKRGWQLKETLHEVLLVPPGADFSKLEEIAGSAPEEEETDDEFNELAFRLEHELRDFIATNLNSIAVSGRRLSLYEDAGRSGVEFSTDVGFIDILAIDEGGAFLCSS